MPKFDFLLSKSQLFKKIPQNFPRRTVMSSYPREIFGFDLVDYSKIKRKGYAYIMVIMDIFSRKVWIRLLKKKDTTEIRQALDEVFKESGNPKKIWADEEGALVGKDMTSWLGTKNIEVYHTHSQFHVPTVERFNRTLKEILYQYEVEKKGNEWTDIAFEAVDQYNSSKHRTLKTTPNAVWNLERTQEKVKHIYETNNAETKEEPKIIYNVGDDVYVVRYKKKLEKGYTPTFESEPHKIAEIMKTNPTTYKVVGSDGNIRVGSYYKNEIQKVKK